MLFNLQCGVAFACLRLSPLGSNLGTCASIVNLCSPSRAIDVDIVTLSWYVDVRVNAVNKIIIVIYNLVALFWSHGRQSASDLASLHHSGAAGCLSYAARFQTHRISEEADGSWLVLFARGPSVNQQLAPRMFGRLAPDMAGCARGSFFVQKLRGRDGVPRESDSSQQGWKPMGLCLLAVGPRDCCHRRVQIPSSMGKGEASCLACQRWRDARKAEGSNRLGRKKKLGFLVANCRRWETRCQAPEAHAALEKQEAEAPFWRWEHPQSGSSFLHSIQASPAASSQPFAKAEVGKSTSIRSLAGQHKPAEGTGPLQSCPTGGSRKDVGAADNTDGSAFPEDLWCQSHTAAAQRRSLCFPGRSAGVHSECMDKQKNSFGWCGSIEAGNISRTNRPQSQIHRDPHMQTEWAQRCRLTFPGCQLCEWSPWSEWLGLDDFL